MSVPATADPAAGEAARARGFGANLWTRVRTAVVAVPLLLAVLFLGPPLLGAGVLAAALLLGLLEFFALLKARGLVPFRKTGLLLAAGIFLEVMRPGSLGPALWPLAALLLLSVTLRRAGDLGLTVPSAAGTLLGAVYLGTLGGSMAALLVLEPVTRGPWRMLLLLVIVWAADTAAFFVGHAVGRHPLAPAVSPRKTVEGTLAGLVGGVGGALLVRDLGLPSLSLGSAAGLGAVVAALGTIGDLVESLFKRWAGVKDSSRLFPGHGGMLDRLDSLLFGAAILYGYFLAAGPGP